MMTIDKTRTVQKASRRTDDVKTTMRVIMQMTREAKKNPDAAFQHIYDGGMIHKDGSIREDLFEK